jgi:type IV pilus assembly protein PilA
MMRINELLRRRDEEGFTLIELMVVVLIIGILIAIAIPTFLGARKRAQDRAAQSNLRNVLTNAKAIYTDHETYADAIAGAGTATGALATAEPSMSYCADCTETVTTGPHDVSVSSPAVTEFDAATMSKSGTCFWIRDKVGAGGPGTQFGSSDTVVCKSSNDPTNYGQAF